MTEENMDSVKKKMDAKSLNESVLLNRNNYREENMDGNICVGQKKSTWSRTMRKINL